MKGPDWLSHLGRPVGRKADGTPLYDCPRCGGKRKLAVWPNRWFCVKEWCGGSIRAQTQNHPGSLRDQLVPEAEPSARPRWECEPIKNYHDRRIRYLLEERNLDFDQINRLKPHSGPDPWRVYLPVIMERGGAPVYWVSRSIVDGRNNYVSTTADGTEKGEVLWGWDQVAYGQDRIILVEGVFDACHAEGSVGLLGSFLSEGQCAAIRQRAPRQVLVCLDGDAGRKGDQVCRQLVRHTAAKVKRVRLPDWLEPDTIRDKAEWEWWLSKAEQYA